MAIAVRKVLAINARNERTNAYSDSQVVIKAMAAAESTSGIEAYCEDFP